MGDESFLSEFQIRWTRRTVVPADCFTPESYIKELGMTQVCGRMFVIRVYYPGPRFEYVYWGETITNVLGHDMTGTVLERDSGGGFGHLYWRDYTEVLSTGEPSFIEGQFQYNNGDVRTFQRLLVPIFGTNGKAHHMVGLAIHDDLPDQLSHLKATKADFDHFIMTSRRPAFTNQDEDLDLDIVAI